MSQTIGSVIIDVKSDTSKLVKGFDSAEKKVYQTTTAMKKSITTLAGAYLSFQGVNAFTGMVKGSIDAADATGKLAEKLAINTESLSKLEYAAGFADVSMGKLTAAMSAMIRRTNNFKNDGTGAASKAMKTLGISAEFAKENFTSTEATFKLLLNKLYEMPDGFEKTAVAQDLFSKSAADVIRLANMGEKAITNYGEQGLKSGAVITEDMAKQSALLNDKIRELDTSFGGIGNKLAAQLLPALLSFSTSLNKNLPDIIETSKQILYLGTVLGATVLTFKGYNKIIQLSALYTAAFGTEMADSSLQNMKFSTVMALSTTKLGMANSKLNIYKKTTVSSTLATKALSKAIKLTPFAIVAGAISFFAESLFDASEKSNLLEVSYKNLNNELIKLTQNELKYESALSKKELRAAEHSIYKLEDDIAYDSIFENELDKKEDLNKLPKLQRALAELEKKDKLIQKALNNLAVSTVANTPDTEVTHISKQLISILDPLTAVKNKYASLRAELTGTAEDTEKYRLKLVSLEKAELEKLNEKNTKKEEKSTNNWQKYYLELGDLKNAWVLEETRLREEHSFLEESKLSEYIALEKEKYFSIEKTRDLYLDITGTSYDLWLAETNSKMIQLATSGEFTAKQLQKAYDVMSQQFDNTQNEEITNNNIKMLDSQLELIESTNTWQSGLQGVAASIGGISTAFSKMSSDNLKEVKAKYKLDAQYEKEKKKYSKNITKLNKIETKYHKDNAKLKSINNEQELEGYSNLAGAASGFFEENSKGYKALQAIQIGLQLAIQATALAEVIGAETSVAASATAATGAMSEAGANATASVTAAGKGDPYTATARVVAMIALMSSAMTMFGGSGGESSGGVSSYQSTYESNKVDIEDHYNPILERLDKQIELLEALNLKGTAGAMSLTSNDLTYAKDYKIGVEQIIAENLSRYTKTSYTRVKDAGGIEQFIENMEVFSSKMGEGFNFFTGLTETVSDKFYSNFEQLREGAEGIENFQFAMLDLLATATELKDYSLFLGDETGAAGRFADYQKSVDIMYEINYNYIMSLIETIDLLSDAADTFKDVYDSISQTSYFMERDLKNAFDDVFVIIGDDTVADYLKSQVLAIEEIEKELDSELISLFLSNDPADLRKQADALQELSSATGVVFTDGAASALDYLDSIELVGEAMATSSNNIKDFVDSFKTDDEIAQDFADSLSVSLASDYEGLISLFNHFSSDILGLTDNEKSFLEENKSYIERMQDANLELLENSIGIVETAIYDIDKTVIELRSASIGGDYAIGNFKDSMTETQSLLNTGDYEAFQDSLSDTITFSSELYNAENFNNTTGMKFAQLVASNQFEAMGETMVSELDVLKQIEENTNDTAEALRLQIANLGISIENLTSSASSNSDTSVSNLVSNAYSSILGRDTDLAGAVYWENQISTGVLKASDLNEAIANAAVSYSSGPTSEVTQSQIDTSKVNAANWKLINGYSNGGYTGDIDVNAIAGFVHGREFVVDAPTTAALGLNGTQGLFQVMVDEIRALRIEVSSFKEENNQNSNQIISNTEESRFIS